MCLFIESHDPIVGYYSYNVKLIVIFIKNKTHPTPRHPELVSGSGEYMHEILKQVQGDGGKNNVSYS